MSPVFQATALPTKFSVKDEDGDELNYQEQFQSPLYIIPSARQRQLDRTPTHSLEEKVTRIRQTSGPISYERERWGDMVPLRFSETVPKLIEIKAPHYQDVSEALRQLRKWTGLQVTEVAEVLGVSRRAFYYWISTGRSSPEKQQEIASLAEVLIPLGKRWSPQRVRVWLTGGDPSPLELLKEGQRDLFESERRVLEEDVQPLMPTRILSEDDSMVHDSPSFELTGAMVNAALTEFASPRQARLRPDWEPPELTDSLPTDE